jgi:hypothetical protein
MGGGGLMGGERVDLDAVQARYDRTTKPQVHPLHAFEQRHLQASLADVPALVTELRASHRPEGEAVSLEYAEEALRNGNYSEAQAHALVSIAEDLYGIRKLLQELRRPVLAALPRVADTKRGGVVGG